MGEPQMKTKKLLHGADYNYDQWINYPDILESDFAYMRKTRCNAASIGIFSWSMLEPEEGRFEFDWMDRLFDRLHENNIFAILATPSGSKPAWLSAAYPEVCQVDELGRREPHRGRHNHCRTSPVYRDKCVTINTQLAERYGSHPALLMWHVSNEYNATDCYCGLCLAAFRRWLKDKYKTLEELNHAWWTTFWSHRFTDWEQIRPGDESIHGLQLDWRRFVSDQTLDFFLTESRPLREITPDIPITTNFMRPNVGLNYWHFAEHVDMVSWDNYPEWHQKEKEWQEGAITAFMHDLHRSYKGRPFLLMESTPSATNWQPISIPKKPNMHLLSSFQAVAHGSNSVQYFQWRAGRGGAEKFHGAVMSHLGSSDTRVFREVEEVGRNLELIEAVGTSTVEARIAVVYDLENEWALSAAQMPGNKLKNYQKRCVAHHGVFWQMSVACDVIDSQACPDFSKYALIVAPMLYMVREGVAERLAQYVETGGVLVLTYLSGLVDDTDLCFLGGFPGPLREIAGVTVEDTDVLYGHYTQTVQLDDDAPALFGPEEYVASDYADRIRLDGGQVVGRYSRGYVKGEPAVTMNSHGKGTVYYLASRFEERFLKDFYGNLVSRCGIERSIDLSLPVGVNCQRRTDGDHVYLFVMNFNRDAVSVDADEHRYMDLLSGKTVERVIELPSYGLKVLEELK
jgi:beta-galactosidase